MLIGISSTSFAYEAATPVGSEPKPIAVEEVISDKKIQQRLSDILVAVGSSERLGEDRRVRGDCSEGDFALNLNHRFFGQSRSYAEQLSLQ